MRAPSILFLLAAVLCVLGAVAHEVLGAPKVLTPLASTDLPADVIWLHHFSWHVGTVAVLGMAGLFVSATRAKNGRILAAFATLMSVGFAALAIGLAVLGNDVLWSTPAPYPWTVIAILGAVGLLMSAKSPE